MKNTITRAHTHDQVAPLSEQFLRGLTESELGHRQYLATDGENIVGVLSVDPHAHTGELVIDPDYRRRGHATSLVEEARKDHPELALWAHGDIAGAREFATAQGLIPTRELLVMAVTAEEVTQLGDAVFPDSVEFVPLTKRRSDGGFVKANNEAFSWHPEQGGWDEERLARARATDWYRPEDDFLLWEDGEVIGFHWMKRHGDLAAGADGEVYVVGLANAGRGRGLGGPLVLAGLHHLVSQGARRIILYVEADNIPAVKAYEELGFHTIERHVLYGKA